MTWGRQCQNCRTSRCSPENASQLYQMAKPERNQKKKEDDKKDNYKIVTNLHRQQTQSSSGQRRPKKDGLGKE